MKPAPQSNDTEAINILLGVYLLFLIGRTDDGLWPVPTSPWDRKLGIAYAPQVSEERTQRIAQSLPPPSLTVTKLVVEAIMSICPNPGEEISGVWKSLPKYRDKVGAYGSRGEPSAFDGVVRINSSARHTASALGIFLTTNHMDHDSIAPIIRWLIEHQRDGGWSIDSETEPDFYSTAYVIDILNRLSHIENVSEYKPDKYHSSINEGLDFLINSFEKRRNRIGNIWKYAKIDNQYIIDTCDTLDKLLPLKDGAPISEHHSVFISDRLANLIEKRNIDGSFGEGNRLLASTIWTADLIARYDQHSSKYGGVLQNCMDNITRWLKSDEHRNNLALIDWAVLVRLISAQHDVSLTTDQAEQMRHLASQPIRPNKFMGSLPSEIARMFGDQYRYVLTKGQPRGFGFLGLLSEIMTSWHTRVPQWAWGAIAIAGLIIALISVFLVV